MGIYEEFFLAFNGSTCNVKCSDYFEILPPHYLAADEYGISNLSLWRNYLHDTMNPSPLFSAMNGTSTQKFSIEFIFLYYSKGICENAVFVKLVIPQHL